MAGHDELDDAVGPAPLRRTVTGQPQETWLTIAEGAKRLADDDRLRATPADPALDGPVRVDDAAGAWPRRGRSSNGDDGCDDERSPGLLEFGGVREDRRQLMPFSCRIAQTF
jgi:hypothetical protein